MNSRQLLKQLDISHEVLVQLVCDSLSELSLIDLERILLLTEMEIEYRGDNLDAN